jgi:hypothetical protein
MGAYKDLVLRISYNKATSSWRGVVLDYDDVEVAGVAGCSSADEVHSAALDAGLDFVRVEIFVEKGGVS